MNYFKFTLKHPFVRKKLIKIISLAKHKNNMGIIQELITTDISRFRDKPRNDSRKNLKLYISPLNIDHRYSLIRKLMLIKVIVQSPGRLRWVCLSLGPFIFVDAYELSRWQLIFRILKHWKFFVRHILNRLFASLVDLDAEVIEASYFFQRKGEFKIDNFLWYLLEQESFSNLRYPASPYGWKTSPLFVYLIFYNSTLALQIFKQIDLFSNSDARNLLTFFPDYETLVNRYSVLNVREHIQSSLNFDDLSRDDNKMLFDVIYNVEIWHQRFIVQEDTWLQIDSTCSPNLDFVAGHWQFVKQNSIPSQLITLKKPNNVSFLHFDEAIYLVGRCDENWYHFLLDTLPRYLFLKNLDLSIPILVRDDLPESAKAILRSILSHKVVFVKVSELVSASTLYFCSARSTAFDSIPPAGIERVSFSPITISKVRETIIDQTRFDKDFIGFSKIFLTRKSSQRNLLNFKSVMKVFELLGFKVLDVNSDFFPLQVSHFSNSAEIVSPGGAVLANIIFMNQNARITVIRSFRNYDSGIWSKLAMASKISYQELIGVPIYFGFNILKRQHSSYVLLFPRYILKRKF